MSQDADLTAAIRAGIARAGPDPDDLAPYLVLADWLQQQGDPRGELIAIQCARETADMPELAANEQALFDAHLAAWLGNADDAYRVGELELVWRRGFVWS